MSLLEFINVKNLDTKNIIKLPYKYVEKIQSKSNKISGEKIGDNYKNARKTAH